MWALEYTLAHAAKAENKQAIFDTFESLVGDIIREGEPLPKPEDSAVVDRQAWRSVVFALCCRTTWSISASYCPSSAGDNFCLNVLRARESARSAKRPRAGSV